MNELLIVVVLGTLPALGNVLGNILAEIIRTRRWFTGVMLHGATGIVIALIGFDLLPRIIDKVPIWHWIAAFLLGAIASVALSYGIHNFNRSSGERTQAWSVYAAIGVDLFSDGLMTGAGSAITLKLGALIAGVQLLANIPGGFASATNLRQRSVSKKTRVVASLALFLGVVLSASAGFFFLRNTSEIFQNTVLAGMMGLLLLATIEDMLPEADAPRPSRWLSSLAFSTGFVAMALVSHFLPQ